jgi:hypothetical protein
MSMHQYGRFADIPEEFLGVHFLVRRFTVNDVQVVKPPIVENHAEHS